MVIHRLMIAPKRPYREIPLLLNSRSLFFAVQCEIYNLQTHHTKTPHTDNINSEQIITELIIIEQSKKKKKKKTFEIFHTLRLCVNKHICLNSFILSFL